MSDAFSRYQKTIFFAGVPAPDPSAAISSCNVTIQSTVDLALGVDESYSMSVTATSCDIIAKTQFGALRGLESFSQLSLWVPETSGNGKYLLRGIPISVNDSPRFPWRGLLIDSSRHYLSVKTIVAILDAMSYNKMNVLHWHVVDDNSWPLVSTAYPAFSQKGAYSQRQLYNAAAVKRIVDAANARGIIIVPEFDMPAHAAVWGAGYPQFVTACPGGQTLLDPTGPAYPAIAELLGEFRKAGLFSGNFAHLGGDEVENFNCWDASQRVQEWKKANNYTTNIQVRNAFQTEIQKIAVAAGDAPIFWEEVFDNNFDLVPTAVVNVWLSAAKTAEVVKKGHRAVHSYGYYLDQQTPPGNKHYFWVDTWQNFYLNDPVAGQNLTPEQLKLVLGGEASQWGEQTHTLNVVHQIFPRAAAIAEKLWTPLAQTGDINTAAPRIERFSCILAQRGVASGPIRPGDVHCNCELPSDLE